MEDFMTLARTRYSVRNFEDKPVEAEVLQKILTAGQVAPTACNSQAVHVYVLKNADIRAKVATLTKCTFGAPMILLVCYETDRTWKNRLEEGVISGEQDAASVATHMMLAAWEQGVGSCWVGYFPPSRLAEELLLPKNHRPVLLMPMGYPSADAKPLALHEETRSLDELVTVL